MFTRSSKDYIDNPEQQDVHLIDTQTQYKVVNNNVDVVVS